MSEKDPKEMTNEELIEALADLDAEKYETANHARRALKAMQGGDDE